jgi:hypothetical protein
VGLLRIEGLFLDARVVPGCDPRLGVPHLRAEVRAEHQDRAWPVAGPHEGVRRPGGTVEEVPGSEVSLLVLDDESACSGQDEERFLICLGVIHVALARLEDGHIDPELRELDRRGSPYSFANQHAAPRVSEDHHSASRTLTTNQPSVTGASPDPESLSRASRTREFSQLGGRISEMGQCSGMTPEATWTRSVMSVLLPGWLDESVSRDPDEVLSELLFGFLGTQLLYVVADLGIADLIDEEPEAVDVLALRAGAVPDVLYRFLRALASLGVFAEVEERVFSHTASSLLLRRESGTGWLEFALVYGSVYRAFAEAVPAARSGENMFERASSAGWWDWLTGRPELGAAFNRAMQAGAQARLAAWKTFRGIRPRPSSM